MASKHPEADIPEDEELDLQDEDDDDMMEGMDLMEVLGSMLTTDDGETLATALVSMKDSTERIAASLEMQNKILVKILSALKPSAPADLA
jgi:hypothetical protein